MDRFISQDLRALSLCNRNADKILEILTKQPKKKIINQFTPFRNDIYNKIEDVSVELPKENDDSVVGASTRAFIDSMLENSNYTQEHVQIIEGKLVLKIKDSIKAYLEVSAPKEPKEREER